MAGNWPCRKRAVILMCLSIIAISTLSAQISQQLQDDLSTFQQQLQLYPDDPDINYNIAQVYYRLNKLDMAAKHLERTLFVDSDDAEAKIKLATIYWKFGKLALARDLLLQAVELRSDDSDAWYGLGIVWADLADRQQAIAAFDKAWQYCSDAEQKSLIIYYSGLVFLAARDLTGFKKTLDRLPATSKYYEQLQKLGQFWGK